MKASPENTVTLRVKMKIAAIESFKLIKSLLTPFLRVWL
jgi:hypothetical protein